ncbi:MAG: nodulation protein NfeD [Elusimicrobiales bacterium]|jgi:membrane-bound serine protease (ClpP class)|nr:nodulation protein NfeD [Elusimicrobiales bacterium]
MTTNSAFLLLLAAALAPAAHAAPAKTYEVRSVTVAPYSGPITPVAAEFLGDAVRRLNAEGGADLLVIALDTPGGLDASMREIIKEMLASKKPVGVYVSPQGARAASAGVFIAMASPLVAMAPGTNIGAAHPVMLGSVPSPSDMGSKDEKGKKKSSPLEDKVLNDASAYIKSITQKTGRNVKWSVDAVKKSDSISAEEAVKAGVADFMAADLDELFAKADGFKAGEFGKLSVKKPAVTRFEQTRRQKFLAAVTDPNIAMILMSLGAAGLFIELYNPGLILPGVVGGISMLLAFYSFQTLSASFAGVGLILLAFIFFIAEIKVMSYGLLTVGGVISMTLGSLMLFRQPSLGGLSISMETILANVIGVVAVTALLAWIVVKAQMRKVVTGIESLEGKRALAKTALSPKGKVLVEGELWDAELASGSAEAGEELVVQKVDGFHITVRKP